MSKNQKYFIGYLNIRHGESVEKVRNLLVANSDSRAWALLDRAAASYYGNGDEEQDDDGYDANGGEIHVSAGMPHEISLPTFLELQPILTPWYDENTVRVTSVDSDTLDGFKALAKSTARHIGASDAPMGHSQMLEVLAKGFGQKNWQVLHDKLTQLEAQKAAKVAAEQPALAAPEEVFDTPQPFDIDVCRIGYGFATIRVMATSRSAAEELALDEAGNHMYSEKESDYQVS